MSGIPKKGCSGGLFQWIDKVDAAKKTFSLDKLRVYTRQEIEENMINVEEKSWSNCKEVLIILQGDIYDIREYIPFHPGGIDEILTASSCGDDCYDLFKNAHSWVNYESLLVTHLKGVIESPKQNERLRDVKMRAKMNMDLF